MPNGFSWPKKKKKVNPWHREMLPDTHSVIDDLQRLGLDAESLVRTRVQRVCLEHEVQKSLIFHPVHMTWRQQDRGRIASWETRHFKRWQLSRDPEKNNINHTSETNTNQKHLFNIIINKNYFYANFLTKTVWRVKKPNVHLSKTLILIILYVLSKIPFLVSIMWKLLQDLFIFPYRLPL